MINTIESLLDRAQTQFNHSTTPNLDAQLLLAHAIARPRSFLLSHPSHSVTPNQAQQFQEWVKQRAVGVPLAYLTGYKAFWDLDLEVTPEVLIPRPETECLIEYVLQHFCAEQPLNVIDLGTGSGAIALALAKVRPQWHITATDLSAAALQVAKRNAARYQLSVQWIHCDWLYGFAAESFDLIISNPPYIAVTDPHHQKSSTQWEPSNALIASDEGLADIRKISQQAYVCLKPSGVLLLEHGFQQQPAVCALFNETYWKKPRCYQDLARLPRFVSITKN